MPADAWLTRAATRDPHRIAVATPAGALTYGELLAAARERAARYRAAQPVPLALPPGREFAVELHACLLAGAVAMPLAPGAPAPAVDPGLLAGAVVVLHTSGTGSDPKPVGLTAANWEASAEASAAVLGLDADERWLSALPVHHVGGLSVLIRSAIYGTTAVLHERFETAAALAELDGAATLVSLVPTTLRRLLDAGLREPARLRCALVGGAGVDDALLDEAAAAGVPVAVTYGLTEACSQVATSAPGDRRLRPLPGLTVEIADDDEIVVSGPTVAPGSRARDGRLHTGDLGWLAGDGSLVVTGRRDDMIVSGGENIWPARVEAVLESHPAVREAGVRGVADPEWGEAVVAWVVAPSDVGPAELLELCRRRLARHEVPKAVHLVDRLPRTPSGKLLRRELR